MTYGHEEKNDKGKYPHITEEERVTHAAQQDTALQSDEHWKEELKRNHYFPAPEDSPVNFSYRVASSTYAVPYHVVGPMTWKYPYHSGQAHEDLSDRLVPASLYALKVTHPGYCSADDKPARATAGQPCLSAPNRNARWQVGTNSCSPHWNNGWLTGTRSMWLPLQRSTAWCGAVPTGRAPRQTHSIRCFATFKLTTHKSTMGASGRI